MHLIQWMGITCPGMMTGTSTFIMHLYEACLAMIYATSQRLAQASTNQLPSYPSLVLRRLCIGQKSCSIPSMSDQPGLTNMVAARVP